MKMIERLKQNKIIFEIVWFFRRLAGITPKSLNEKFHQKRANQLIDNYLSQNKELRKLQIGAQNNSVVGWLNVDILPKNLQVSYMDATKPFPFADNTFDYIFTEHMIEHISFEEAKFMLQECFRVLKPNGKIRIATPDILNTAKILTDPQSERSQTYIQHYIGRFYNNNLPNDPVYAVNRLFYGFHHRFIHSESSLQYLLENNKFRGFKLCEVGISEDNHLNNLEQHGKEMGDLVNKIETIVVEAQK
jgi:predicted SAM-dependent methyltransferase